ncbi:hypothetical protein CYMTET_26216 [Cymbomonas tetramitiformis]|uniref:Uncharacterized protein n=1 Tax=Cymbomonas tetramitiformis TaxID=36881 RepID=A0AAE0KY96_9CHLO|nr:hypothetical protein CYMTET_26216 [Cymbomonas tetramitiformis]
MRCGVGIHALDENVLRRIFSLGLTYRDVASVCLVGRRWRAAAGPGAAAVRAFASIRRYVRSRPTTIERALEALGALGPRAGQHTPNIVALLGDLDPRVRNAAAYALGSLGEYAAPHLHTLVARLQQPAGNFVCGSTWALVAVGRLGPHAEPVLEALSARLVHENESERREGVLVLSWVAHHTDPFSWEGLIVGSEVHVASLEVQSQLSGMTTEVWARLVRQMARRPGAVAAVAALLVHEARDARVHSALVLGRLGETAAAHVAALAALLEDADEEVREAVAQEALPTLAREGVSEGVLSSVVARLDHAEARTRVAALVALGMVFQPVVVEYLDVVLERLDDAVAEVGAEALRCLGRMALQCSEPLACHVDAIVERFVDIGRFNPWDQLTLLESLVRHNPTACTPAIVAMLELEGDYLPVRTHALKVLEMLGKEELVPHAEAIVAQLGVEDEWLAPELRCAALATLRRLGEHARPYRAVIAGCWQAGLSSWPQEQPYVQWAAMELDGQLAEPPASHLIKIVAWMEQGDLETRRRALVLFRKNIDHAAMDGAAPCVDAVAARLSDVEAEVRCEAVDTFSKLLLCRFEGDPLGRTREAVCPALKMLADCATQHIGALVPRLEDEDESTKFRARILITECLRHYQEQVTPHLPSLMQAGMAAEVSVILC